MRPYAQGTTAAVNYTVLFYCKGAQASRGEEGHGREPLTKEKASERELLPGFGATQGGQVGVDLGWWLRRGALFPV